MEVQALEIPDVKLLTPRVFRDARGDFCETWSRGRFTEAGLDCDFVQDNHSVSTRAGTVRGLHFQSPPAAQAKLVRCVRGRMRDVAVDIRRGSPTFGRHVCVELDAEHWRQLFVPRGFAHGFVTLEPDTHVIYKVDAPYSPQHDAGLYWADPALGITWGVSEEQAVVSDKDHRLPRWAAFDSPFTNGEAAGA